MDQVDIFKNMTKGEWKRDPNGYYFHSVAGNTILEMNVDVEDTEVQTEMNRQKAKANSALIDLMKRETIDKGINPEGVPGLKLFAARIFDLLFELHLTRKLTEDEILIMEHAKAALIGSKF